MNLLIQKGADIKQLSTSFESIIKIIIEVQKYNLCHKETDELMLNLIKQHFLAHYTECL